MRSNSPASSLHSNPGTAAAGGAAASATLQEGDGVRKSGPIVLLNCSKKKGQTQYAVLSERALELHESEKAQRKRKATKSIVDLSKCFNVSQQTCPKSRCTCVCLLMPDECFAFRGENGQETADWYSSLLFAVISARALRLGRPVFPNEFFECVWDVTVWPSQPKLKMPPQNPDNSPNICAKLPHLHLAGKKRLCFYPHTIIICSVGIEPANNGLPKSGIPPFRTTDFVEFSRHFIASYGSQEKFFIMRIGRGSPMGSCEAWIQCESEATAADVKNKLADIIRRETEKKQCALLALGNIAKGSTNGGGASQQRTAHHHHHHHQGSSSAYASSSSSNGLGAAAAAATVGGVPPQSDGVSRPPDAPAAGSYQNRSPELETISEDEQQHQLLHEEGPEERSPANSMSSSSGCCSGAVSHRDKKHQQYHHHHHHHSSLSQSAREKRLELRECKAKVDSLEEEEQRFREQQHSAARQEAIANGEPCWRLHNWNGNTADSHHRPSALLGPVVCTSAGAATLSHSHSRPAYLGCPESKLFRRRGSATSMDNNASTLRSKSAGLEQQMPPLLGSGRNWNRKSPFEMNNNDNNNNNGINDFDIRWINRTDSLNLLGATTGTMGSFFYGPEEETEDSGGTLRIPCADGEENNSQENSRSASSLNLAVAQPSTNSASDCGGDGTGAGCVVQALVECHATAVELLEEQQQQQQQQLPLSDVVVDERRSQQHCCAADNEQGEEGTSTEEEEEADAGKGQRIDLATVRRRRKQKQKQQQQHLQYRLQHGHDEQQQQQQPGAVVEQQQQQQHRRRQQQLMMATTESSSLETAEEADQSCCSSSIASSSSVTCREDAVQQKSHGAQMLNAAIVAFPTDHTQQQCHHPQQMPPVSSQTEFAESAAHKVADEHHEYITMDKVSCCSDSFSHLAVPQQWERQQSSTGCCQEEICSCASDSGDSCYSSMANGQLNPRAFSFSSATDGSAGSGGGGTVSVTASAARAAVGRGSGGGRAEGRHWTMGVVSGMALHRNCGANGNNCHLVHLPPRTHHMSSSAVLPGTVMANPNCSNIIHHNNNCWPDSSSSSRFSMETSLITPLEEDEKQVSFGDEEERDKLCTEMNQRAGDELRKRAFSLGSKSWITKPFRKLSSTHGSGASSSSTAQHHHNHNQQQQQQQHNQHAHRQLHNSESARSCTSSLAGSVHADLSAPDPHHQQHQQHNSSSQTRLCHRLGSSSSFASCSITGHNNRSDSVGSAHSAAAFSLPGSSLMSQKLSSRRVQQQSDDDHQCDDLVELEFMPQKQTSSTNLTQHSLIVANRSAQCVPSTVDDTLRSSTRARTSSCDDHNQQQFATLHQLQQAMSTPLGMGRASASNALDRSQQRHHTRGWAGTRSSWSSQDQFTMMGQQQLRPSESFIRSIQQHQQELQQKNDQQQKRHKLKSDFPLQEVHCFIAPAEREKIDAVTSPRGDSLSMRSQRSGSGSTFETIQECAAGGATASIGPKRDSRASNRRPSSRPPSSLASADSQAKLHQPAKAEEEDEYVLSNSEALLKVII